MSASIVSARIEALSRPPVASSPRPRKTYSPSPMVRADVGEGAHVDHGGAQLGELALGQVRGGRR